MNIDIAKKRIVDVIKIDSITSSRHDFLATHIPFKKLVIKDSINEFVESYSDENDFFAKYFCSDFFRKNHQFIIVDGPSGGGKSHFIRWIEAKLSYQNNGDDCVLLIKRGDNTLRGTIRQLLQIPEIRYLENNEKYKRLLKASETISETNFRNEIFHQILKSIANDIDSNKPTPFGTLKRIEKKKLRKLIFAEEFAKNFIEEGPVQRIYNRIVRTTTTITDEVAEFKPSDFIVEQELADSIGNSGDCDAGSFAKELIDNGDGEALELAKKISTYLNGLLDTIIQSCAGIEPGDMKEVINDVRRELRKKNKGLILLIEDITAFAGVSKDLIEALLVEHTGEYESSKLCRLVSLVGTTTEYYREFRTNIAQRITTQVTINDDSIGQTDESLFLFFGKYLNALSLEESIVKEWCNNDDSNDATLPIYIDTNNPDWETVEFYSKKISLYPFTKASIRKLYDDFLGTEKTPRIILREIIHHAVSEMISGVEHFLTFTLSKNPHISMEKKTRLERIGQSLDANNNNNYTKRLVNFAYYYGDENLDTGYSIDNNVWQLLGFGDAYKKLGFNIGTNQNDPPVTPPVDPPPTPPVGPSRQTIKYNEFLDNLSSWKNGNDFVNPRDIGDLLNDFTYNVIDWPICNVPLSTKKLFEDSIKTPIGFVGGKESSTNKIVLDRDDNTELLLNALARYDIFGNKTWNYNEADEDIFTITSWIYKNSKRISDCIKEENGTPYYIKVSMAILIIYKVLSSQSFKNNLLDPLSILSEPSITHINNGHSDIWNQLLERINDYEINITKIRENLVGYYFITQGVKSSSVVVLKYTDYIKDIKELLSNDLYISVPENISYIASYKNSVISLYKDVFAQLATLIASEKENISSNTKIFYESFAYDSDDDFTIDDIEMFWDVYKNFSNSTCDLYAIPNRIDNVEKMLNNANTICETINGCKEITDELNTLQSIHALTKNPVGKLSEYVLLLKNLQSDIEKAENYISTLEASLEEIPLETFDEKYACKEEIFNKIKGL